MSRRGLNLNIEAIYSNTLNRVYTEGRQEEERPYVPAQFAPKFRNTTPIRVQETQSVEYNPVSVGKRTGSFANETEAIIASRRLEEKIREAALRRK